MDQNSINTLKNIIAQRQNRARTIGGEVFAIWGTLNIITSILHKNIWHSPFIWMIMVAIGAPFQAMYVRKLKKRSEFKLFWSFSVSETWLAIVAMLPLIFYVFPHVFHLYTQKAIFPIAYIGLAGGMYFSGILTEKLSMKIGGLLFLACSVLTGVFQDQAHMIHGLAMFFGFIVPGIWSKYEQKKQ